MKDWHKLILITALFMAAYYTPFEQIPAGGAVTEAFLMLQDYAREHVIYCLVPAFFVAGAIASFISQGAVIKYFGGGAHKVLAYSVASVSGTVLAVCSCTVLPLFTGIYKRGAGLGPAVAFLYSGPAINILAIILTARVLGWQLGFARALGAVIFAVIIGLIMARLYRREEDDRSRTAFAGIPEEHGEKRSRLQNLSFFAVLVFILVFAAWGSPAGAAGFWYAVFRLKWYMVAVLAALTGFMAWRWFNSEERTAWLTSTRGFALQILPLLFAGVVAAGLLLGRPGTDAGLIPAEYIETLVGGNSFRANFAASILGAIMYFATLTEVPILQGLLGSGMGQGPALALLLSGPALSLPNMLVIRNVLGTRKTVIFIVLVAIMATFAGMIYGYIAASSGSYPPG